MAAPQLPVDAAPAVQPLAPQPALFPAITPLRAALVLSALALLYGALTLKHHGVTYDAPALYYAGERTVFAELHRSDDHALDLNAPDPHDFHPHFGRSPDYNDPVHYPVLPGLIGAFLAAIFSDRLTWLAPLDAHQLGLVLMHVFGIFLFTLYACRLLGRGAGIAAAIALATYPTGLGHSFNNPKDWPCALFFGLALFSAAVGLLQSRGRHLIASGVFFGLALSCKFNAIFIPITLVLWLPLAAWAKRTWNPGRVPPTVLGGLLAAPYVGAVLFVALWPWLYQGRPQNWVDHVHEYLHFMLGFGIVVRDYWTSVPVHTVAAMTPPVVLVAAIAGVLRGAFGGREQLAKWGLLVLGCGAPILRVSIPDAGFYDANRHYIEYVPFLAGLAGLGAQSLFELAVRVSKRARLTPQHLVMIGATVGIAGVAWPIASTAPYEVVYWNFLEGGLGGAEAKAPFLMKPIPSDHRIIGTEGDYWYSSSRDALRDALAVLPKGKPLGFCGPPWHVIDAERAEFNWKDPAIEYTQGGFEQTPVALVIWRETSCGCARIRSMESKRPVLKRVERGGGMVYEILGAADGKPHTPAFPDNPYCHDPYALAHD